MHDPFELTRFVDAQQPVFDRVMVELHAGRKTSHWMWFIFPQLQGLGRSEIAQRFSISGADEAQAYLRHPCLGPRLERCVKALLEHRDKTARQILGAPDDLKLHSSLTLFAWVSDEAPLYKQALDQFFAGKPDDKTLAMLGQPFRSR
ncbi:DUF1810 domain-containing protein [Pseudomonas sp. GD03842]|uniref:DUF1810 domain-containing protein n=1 Tax=Pseudomonas sp. GD03842 TaxID=2975385 RepID=UPI00244B0990|nr:DUF1810 domain-containing protein [Pseudomonas sp. GD03842]MDH0746839.1 DUF1810 domain-containing protein [Pseudomonas sp. GD03842]